MTAPTGPLSRWRRRLRILDDLEGFCRKKRVKGQVSFSGGNPLFHPDFSRIYRAAADRGFTSAILGNPAPREQLEELIAIQPPGFFQVSLEGFPEYNDFIRGKGHFDKVMDFLDLLRISDVYSMVMLTLTKDNIRQVLPLGERLRAGRMFFSSTGWRRSVKGPPLSFHRRRNMSLFSRPILMPPGKTPSWV